MSPTDAFKTPQIKGNIPAVSRPDGSCDGNWQFSGLW